MKRKVFNQNLSKESIILKKIKMEQKIFLKKNSLKKFNQKKVFRI